MIQSFSSDVPFRGLGSKPFTGNPPCVLGKRTVIYGRNGTGKTTLTEALRLADLSGKTDASAFRARIVGNDGAIKTVDLAPGSLPFRLFVYNRYYVQDSLQLFLDGGGHALPILKLGARNVKAESDLAGLRDYLGVLERRQGNLSAAVTVIMKDRDTVEQITKANVIASLARADAAYYNQTRFQVTQVRKLLDDEAAVSLNEDALNTELEAATTPALKAVEMPAPPQALAPSLHTTINTEILSSPVESVRLARLASDAALSDWVETGINLHKDGDLCAFCQSGTVSAATLDAYRQHFSAALEALRLRMTKAIEYLEAQRDGIASWLATVPTAEAFLPDFRWQAKTHRTALEKSVGTLGDCLNHAANLIKRRLADPLNPLPETDLLTEAFPDVDLSEFLKIVADNKAACSSQAERVKRAKAAVEAHHGALKGGEYRKLGLRLEIANNARKTLADRTRAIESEAQVLQHSQQDSGRIAGLIDSDLREHFGHAHLHVSASDDGKGYVVTRAGQVAQHLSEGERNAIAFTYFLRSLEEDGVDASTTVVVIDDPVTSLDREALFAAFALAEVRTANFAQTIVLTHDYEYFRLQLMTLSGRWNSSQKRIRSNNAAEKLLPEVSLLELRAITLPGHDARHGEVREIPMALIRHPSEYHFLFFHVAEAVQGNSLEYLPLVGNAGRRLLEGFLSFRAPSEIKFQAKVDAVARAASIDASLKERVVRFLHSQSHREEPRPSAALDFPSIEAELVAALTFIHQADEGHFTDMCTAVDVKPAELLVSLATQQPT